MSVVIPTRDRLPQLQECLEAIATSVDAASCPVEVIVVDDGSSSPILRDALPRTLDLVPMRLEGAGPAAARNAGVTRARGSIVLFTDDDTAAVRDWIEATVRYLDDNPAAVGVEGPVTSLEWDPLFENSIRVEGPGHHVTCNIAFRRDVLISVGGFREDVFRFAHGEDRDLAARCLRYGPIGFADEMIVAHSPRPVVMKHVVQQAKWVRDEIALFALHPEMTEGWGMPVRVALVWGTSSKWMLWAWEGDRRSLRRLARGISAYIVAAVVGTWTACRTPTARALRRQSDGRASHRMSAVGGAVPEEPSL